MSLVDLRPFAAALAAPRLPLDITDPSLSDAEREADRVAILAILRSVASQLAQRSATAAHMRRRLGAIIEGLIAIADAIDGDADLEDGCDAELICEDEGAQCDDEGEPADNGLADADGLSEQGFDGLAERLHLVQGAALYAAQRADR